jgi:hypothetical protein
MNAADGHVPRVAARRFLLRIQTGMDLFLAISQGIGVSVATGFRSFLAPLLIGVFARAGVGIDFGNTDYEFLQSTPFLAAMLALVAASSAYERPPRRLPLPALVLASAVLGALEFAGSLASGGYSAIRGVPAGVVCAALACVAMQIFIRGAAARLAAAQEQGARLILGLYADAGALGTAALALLVPPTAYVALAFCVWVLISRRRREAKKYEGLRVLR